ncbi:PREDICTED: chymotrypsin inhibitor-like isoform X2 [Nicrophorus vespilloides]|uniref:Chymotrypsin inhibitor-like isoform X2 n=1 Tax=Nicrophorus vespilloides TaxID=110193 RepID=A0ABM1NJJ6_NICVS|nr:PREDICTED: chymotrypsin inhibitor-like isoform X2 [Nicrophorus vespilloides]
MKLLVVFACSLLMVATSTSFGHACGPNEYFIECGSGCAPPLIICGKIIEPYTPPKYCPTVCRRTCVCKNGYLRNSKGECVLPEVCE